MEKDIKQHVTMQPANPGLAERFHLSKSIDVNKMAARLRALLFSCAIVAPLQPTSQSEPSRKVSYMNSQEKGAFSKCYTR